MSVLAIRGHAARFPDWPTWRAATARPDRVQVEVRREACPHCWCAGVWLEVIRRRHPDLTRMALEDRSRRPHLLPMQCPTCDGQGAIETAVAVTR